MSGERVQGRLVAVNVGADRVLWFRGRPVHSGIVKTAASDPVAVGREGLAGDVQADRRVHGGPDKAVYAYGIDDYGWWEDELGRALDPGLFGENLTVGGLDVSGAVVGERWRVGTALLEVCQPRLPCYKLGLRLRDGRFPARFAAACLPGAYLRVLETGEVTSGDDVIVVERPEHRLTVADVARAFHAGDSEPLPAMLVTPALPERWRVWAEERLARPPVADPGHAAIPREQTGR